MASCNVKKETDCISDHMSPIEPGSNIYKIIYPEKMYKDEKRATKKETIKGHPETLFADNNSKGRITNLLFFTHHGDKWYKVFCAYYKFHTKATNDDAKILEVGSETDPKLLKIHVYKNGKVMLQGTEERLREFATIFNNLKDKTSSDNRGKITTYFSFINDSRNQSQTDESRGKDLSQEENTDNHEEEGASQQKEENGLKEDESNEMQLRRDCASNQEEEVEEEKGNIKNKEEETK